MRDKFFKLLVIIFWMFVGVVLWECGIVSLLSTVAEWIAYLIQSASSVDPAVIDSSERTIFQKIIPGGR